MGLNFLGLAVLVLIITLLVIYMALGKRRAPTFREIPAFEALKGAIERAVEAGERVHFSLGTGSVIGTDAAPALAGLATLAEIARVTSLSDRPVVVTTGDGAMSILAQDTLRSAYTSAGALDRYRPTAARMLGPTPFSYVASLPTLMASENVSANILLGAFGSEGALAADFGERRDCFVMAGTDDVQSQALLYATAAHPLIGEEVFAGGAYLRRDRAHLASLRVQDTMRFILILVILLGAVLGLLGVDL